MLTIGQLAKKYSLSRSTLIYYDNIGLLRPSGRSNSNYRLYSDSDLERLDKISLFRSTGISLELIASLLDNKHDDVNKALEGRLLSINREIQKLREQQSVIVALLQSEQGLLNSRILTKERWVSLLKSVGMKEEDMCNWHIEFERMSPEAHQDFLESLGIGPEEIDQIRGWSRAVNTL